MAKNKISEFSANPANNTDIAGIDIAEGCAPSGINNAIRELMAQLKDMITGADGDSQVIGGNLTVNGTTSLAVDLPVSDGGTGASTAANARTNLGLGTMATQAANNVAITGGNVAATLTGNLTGNVTGNVTGNAGGTSANVTGIVAVANGGTNANNATTARSNLGLGSIATQNANSVSITGGSVTGITDLNPADGGTGASSLAGVVIGNGTNPMTARLPNTAGNVLTSTGGDWQSLPLPVQPSLGVNQTWQNMLGSRDINTTYTNSTGKPIFLAITGSVFNAAATFLINGEVVADVGEQAPYPGQQFVNFNIVIPNGNTYNATGNWGLTRWFELR